MNRNLNGIDTLVASAAQLELSRLSREHRHEEVNFKDIQAFREILSTLCSEPQSKEIIAILEEVIEEFCFGQPCRKEVELAEDLNSKEARELKSLKTLENLKGILSEFDLLLEHSFEDAFALRLYQFCCIFSKHLNKGNESRHFNKIRLSETEIVL